LLSFFCPPFSIFTDQVNCSGSSENSATLEKYPRSPRSNRNISRGRYLLLATTLVPVLIVASAGAQSDPMQPDLRPFAPGDYSSLDTVSTVNGGVQLHIPLYSIPQRGNVKLDIWLSYVSPNFSRITSCTLNSLDPTYPCYQMWESSNQGVVASYSTQVSMTEVDALFTDGGNTYSDGYYWLLTTADGASHKMAMVSTGVYRTIDGTGWLYSEPTCTATDSAGTSYVYSCTQRNNSNGQYNNQAKAVATQLLYVQDTNGNRINLNYTSYVSAGVTFYTLTGWTDTYGRSIGLPTAAATSACSSSNSLNTTWSIPGLGNAYTFCYSTVQILTNFWNGADTQQIHFLLKIRIRSGNIRPAAISSHKLFFRPVSLGVSNTLRCPQRLNMEQQQTMVN